MATKSYTTLLSDLEPALDIVLHHAIQKEYKQLYNECIPSEFFKRSFPYSNFVSFLYTVLIKLFQSSRLAQKNTPTESLESGE